MTKLIILGAKRLLTALCFALRRGELSLRRALSFVGAWLAKVLEDRGNIDFGAMGCTSPTTSTPQFVDMIGKIADASGVRL